MEKRKSGNHTIDIIFPLAFILIFCLCVVMFILAGSKVYRSTVAGLKENYTIRTAIPYIQEKCRECGNWNQIEIMENGSVLAIYEEINQVVYATYIYQKEGYLRELYTKKTEHPQFEAGQKLVELKEFQVKWEGEKLLSFTLRADDQTNTIYMSAGN